MHKDAKETIRCPICGANAQMYNYTHYGCKNCKWNSLNNTVDVFYNDSVSGVLSNFFPHKFVFQTSTNDVTHCASMESFIQSLKVKEPVLQRFICENYIGEIAFRLKPYLLNWQEDGLVYWNGKAIVRDSEEYTSLITTAYDCLFESNPVFRELILPKFKDTIIIHSIGKDSKSETLLTEEEFRYQLNRLISRL